MRLANPVKSQAVRVFTRLFLPASTFVVLLAIGKIHAEFIGDYDFSRSTRFLWVLVFAFLSICAGYAFGFPDTSSVKLPIQGAAVAAVIPSLAFALFQTAAGSFLLPRFFLVTSVPVVTAVFLVASRIGRGVAQTSFLGERVLLLAEKNEFSQVEKDLSRHVEVPFVLVPPFESENERNPEEFARRCEAEKVTTIVFSSSYVESEFSKMLLQRLHSEGVRIRDISHFYDEYFGKVPIRELEFTSLLFDVREVHQKLYSRLSRLLDISVSLIGCLLLIAVIPLVFIGNFFGNRGPLFFSQPRVGKGLKNFDILKFRSMVVGTGASSWTTDDDPRITTFGRWLRKSHLDEVPQFWNMLRGDLSIVGPRPEQPHYVEQLNEQIPFYRMRHIVRPGLTGWAQVNYPYGSNATDAYEKLQYEFWYLRHQGLGLDMKILARTLRHVIGFRGR